ncbi:hypothetical protein AGABI2DRAFT_114306 [Agaricus bisporus var. bisporus H97]|uniref:hypothetical protein n=1 Tax=Agaricus bisporus var. bisporus (strain H97 / ATCC MYA-4626 / FGSC 10389) TaxID=936046 RepID=UPI00029F638D|nr:hypothetical protein AGABI2DRAFT_114306 [Agaricus bisporus var. bisporus H97]EKV51579.1 hypothetical protein AGABI2DRAFT_114306 [Agaricus bisporus var. bisporus H97]
MVSPMRAPEGSNSTDAAGDAAGAGKGEAGNDGADNAGDGTVSGAGNARNSTPSGAGNDGTGKQVARADSTTLARWVPTWLKMFTNILNKFQSNAGQMAVVVPSIISTGGLQYLASRRPACALNYEVLLSRNSVLSWSQQVVSMSEFGTKAVSQRAVHGGSLFKNE